MSALHSAEALAHFRGADVAAVLATIHRSPQVEDSALRKWSMSDPKSAIGMLPANNHETATVQAIRSNRSGCRI